MSVQRSPRQIELINAAGKILTKSGAAGLTTKKLALEVGFSESAIYRHFSSKEEIVLAMLDYMENSMEERYQTACHTKDTPEDQFRCLFQNQCDFFSNNAHFVTAFFSDGLMEQSQAINDGILKVMNLKRKYLIPILDRGQKGGTFNSAIKTEELAEIIVGAFRFNMLQWKLSNFSYDIKSKGATLTASLLELIKSKSIKN